MLTKEGLAARLNGREYCEEMSKMDAADAKASGLVVVFGYSDDNVELRGAIDDEVGAFDGTTVRVTPLGVLQDWDSINRDDEDEAETYFNRKRAGFREIQALWSAEPGYSWTFKTDIPHATFEIRDDDEPYCRGIVFALSDVLAPATVAA